MKRSSLLILTHRARAWSPSVGACIAGGGLAFAVLGHTGRALAIDTEITASTAAQGYEASSPWGSPTVTRRRFMQTLGLGVYHIGADAKPGEAEFFVKLRMRLDADFGINKDEVTYAPDSSRFVPGLAVAPIDLMYGYIEGRNLAHGLLGFRLGRQYTSDSLGWWAFDGGLVRLTTPAFFEVQVYGGLEERGGLPLSTPRFEQQGVWRGDRTGYDSLVYPQYLKSSIAPAYGVALESSGVTWIHGRADYRKVLNTGSVVVEQLPTQAGVPLATYDQTRTSSEKLGWALDASAMKIGGVKGGLVYDLYNALFSSWYAGADWYGPAGISVGADYDYLYPTFDGDSIFNFFSHDPMRTMTGRIGWDSSQGFAATATGGVRYYYTDGNPATFGVTNAAGTQDRATDQTKETDVLASLSARYRWSAGRIDFRGMLDTGDRGRREGGDLSGEKTFSNGRWLALARLSLFDWRDAIRPDRDATSLGYVVGGGFRPGHSTRVQLEWEHETNRLVGQRFRVLALLDVAVMP